MNLALMDSVPWTWKVARDPMLILSSSLWGGQHNSLFFWWLVEIRHGILVESIVYTIPDIHVVYLYLSGTWFGHEQVMSSLVQHSALSSKSSLAVQEKQLDLEPPQL